MEWKHIKTELPRNGEYVVIWTDAGGYFIAQYVDEVKQWHNLATTIVNIDITRAPYWFKPTPPEETL